MDAGLIVPADDGGWRFSHPLIHDAAYAGLLTTRRRALHARIADHLEAAGDPSDGEPRSRSIGRRPGDRARAIPLLDEAAAAALALGARDRGGGVLADGGRAVRRSRDGRGLPVAGGRGARGLRPVTVAPSVASAPASTARSSAVGRRDRHGQAGDRGLDPGSRRRAHSASSSARRDGA